MFILCLGLQHHYNRAELRCLYYYGIFSVTHELQDQANCHYWLNAQFEKPVRNDQTDMTKLNSKFLNLVLILVNHIRTMRRFYCSLLHVCLLEYNDRVRGYQWVKMCIHMYVCLIIRRGSKSEISFDILPLYMQSIFSPVLSYYRTSYRCIDNSKFLSMCGLITT